MTTIEAIAEREDVSKEAGISKYGPHSEAHFADPKNAKYPLDSEAHTRAAISYFSMPKNRSKYSAEDQKTIWGRIKAAAKKYDIELAEDKDDSDKAEAMLVQCDIGYPIALVDNEPPSEIMYMPVGRQKISPLVNGKPTQEPIDVEVDASVTETLQRELESRLSREPRPYGDFNHESKSASFLPKKFLWRDGEGLFLAVDWTASGRNAVKGR